jgi:sigma-B regulation protein RsbU (phosphoserine phosphatase)
LAAVEADAASVMVQLDALITDDPDAVSDPALCSLVAAWISPAGDGAEAGLDVELVLAGHPPPVVCGADGTVTVVPSGDGGLLNLGSPFAVTPARLTLRPGEALVLYTDGITERRTATGFWGEDGLCGFLETRTTGASLLQADEVVDAAVAASSSDVRDDMAVVVLAAPGPAGA